MVHHYDNKIWSLVPVLRQTNPVHSFQSCSSMPMLTLHYHLFLDFPTGLFPSTFPHQDPVYTSTHTFYMPLPHNIMMAIKLGTLTTCIIFGDKHKSWNCRYTIFSCLVLTAPLRHKYLLQNSNEVPHFTLFSITLSLILLTSISSLQRPLSASHNSDIKNSNCVTLLHFLRVIPSTNFVTLLSSTCFEH